MINKTVLLKKLIQICLIGTFVTVAFIIVPSVDGKYDPAYLVLIWAGISLLPILGVLFYHYFSSAQDYSFGISTKQIRLLTWMLIFYYILVLCNVFLIPLNLISPPVKMFGISYFWIIPFQLLIIISFLLPLFKKKLLNAANDTQADSEDAETVNPIFFSYAWGDNSEDGESREAIVNSLYDSLKEDGYNVVRDKADLGYSESISDFMKKIGQGNLILVFISEKYFKSHFCMYELTEIARNSRFEQKAFTKKIIPIPVEYIDFTQPDVLTEYFNHWETEKAKWSEFIQSNIDQATKAQYSRFEKTKHIQRYFGELSDWLADVNQSTTTLLSKNNFAAIKDTIFERLEG